MTAKELQRIEKELAKRGYRKWTVSLTSKESYTWFKSFILARDEDREPSDGYQIGFRVWGPYWQEEEQSRYGFDFWTSGIGLVGRYDMNANWKPICDIDRFEAVAKDFHELIMKYEK